MALSVPGLICGATYAAGAMWVVIGERAETGGGWITLRGMGAFLVTMPISAPAEMLGLKLDFRRNLDMAVAIGGCALLVYGFVVLAEKGIGLLRGR